MSRSGLAFTDLETWERWAASRDRARRALSGVRSALRSSPHEQAKATLWEPTGQARTLVVIDKATVSCRHAAQAPIAHLDAATTAVLAPAGDLDLPAGGGWVGRPWLGVQELPGSIAEALTLGSYLQFGSEVAAWARKQDVRHSVIQHGLITPWSPPPAPGDRLLAWTDEDAEFWSAGQASVTTEVVGSQLLWHAASLPQASIVDQRPVMLGQLHGLELGRMSCLSAYLRFCRAERADYRPHPNERDLVSRSLHKAMRTGGITFEGSGRPLDDLRRPIVSIFSTGTLEAAHRGLPAWVTHPDPPAWIRDFWRRYRLAEWGSNPTEAWASAGEEPAKRVAVALGG